MEQYDREKPLVVAKNIGGRDMAASVQSKLRLLKVREEKTRAVLIFFPQINFFMYAAIEPVACGT